MIDRWLEIHIAAWHMQAHHKYVHIYIYVYMIIYYTYIHIYIFIYDHHIHILLNHSSVSVCKSSYVKNPQNLLCIMFWIYIYISTIKNIFYRDIPLVWSLLLSAWAPVARCCRSWWPEKRWSCRNNRNTSQRPAGKFAEWGELSQYYDHLPRYIYIYIYLSIYLSIYGSVRIFH